MTSTMMALWSPWKNPRWTISSRRWMFVLHDCIEENNVMLMLVLLIFLFRLLILLLLFVLLLLMYSFSYSWTYIRLRKSETALTRSRPVWRRSRGSTAPFSPLLKRMRVGNPVSTAAPALEDFYSCFWSCLFCCLCFYWFYYWYFLYSCSCWPCWMRLFFRNETRAWRFHVKHQENCEPSPCKAER